MKAYVVKGSEDGNLGVYSSKKRAILVAKSYVSNGADQPTYDSEYNIAEYSDGSVVVGHRESWVTAEVEKFEMNA